MIETIALGVIMAIAGLVTGMFISLWWQLAIFVVGILFLFSKTLNSMDLVGLWVGGACIAFLVGIVLGDIAFLIQKA